MRRPKAAPAVEMPRLYLSPGQVRAIRQRVSGEESERLDRLIEAGRIVVYSSTAVDR